MSWYGKVGLHKPTLHEWDGCKACMAYTIERYGSTVAYMRSLSYGARR